VPDPDETDITAIAAAADEAAEAHGDRGARAHAQVDRPGHVDPAPAAASAHALGRHGVGLLPLGEVVADDDACHRSAVAAVAAEAADAQAHGDRWRVVRADAEAPGHVHGPRSAAAAGALQQGAEGIVAKGRHV